MRIVAALCLCLAGAAVSGVLLLQHHGEPSVVSAVNQACGDGQTSGCEDVARSSWSRFAGLPVAAWGLAFYLSLALLLALALAAPPELRDPLAGIVVAALALGLLVDLALLGVQAVAIHAYCALCILTYVLERARAVRPAPGPRGRARPGSRGGTARGPARPRRLGPRDARARGGRPRGGHGPLGPRRPAPGPPAGRARNRASPPPPPRPAADSGSGAAPAPSSPAPTRPRRTGLLEAARGDAPGDARRPGASSTPTSPRRPSASSRARPR